MGTKNIVVLLAFFFLGVGAQAQFWKKIKDRAKEAAEETVMNKTAEKAAEKTDKTLDKVFDAEFLKKSNIDPSVLPETYEYTWKYTLQMQHRKGTVKMQYHLKEDTDNFASKIIMEKQKTVMGMTTIIDPDLGFTAMLMNSGGRKFGQIIATPDDMIEDLAAEDYAENSEFKKIGTKEILGFTCQGAVMENEDVKMTIWVAMDTPVSLGKVGNQNLKQMPKGFDAKWLENVGKNSLMMEMDMVNKKRPKQNAKMTCVELAEEYLTINMSEYEFPQVKMQEQMED